MSKLTFKPNPRMEQIFDDLEKYKEFCVEYGYKFDEAELYNQRSFAYRQYTKFATGKPVKEQWTELIERT